MSYFNSLLSEMIGTIDGVNKTFTTPLRFVPGTIRVIWNGQVYDEGDTRHGWSEIDDITIETTFAPRVGDTLQAFYQVRDSEHIGLDNVYGSPYSPFE